MNITDTAAWGEKNTSIVQTLLPSFKQPFAGNSDWTKAITNAFFFFIAATLQPYSVVENTGFKTHAEGDQVPV